MKKLMAIISLFILITISVYGENESFIIKEINLELVKCPAGSFMMGSPDDELGRWPREKLHQVTLTKPFYIGKYEVTQSQYESMYYNPSYSKGPNRPVEKVDWEYAKSFCDALNSKYKNILPHGYKFDLPTEAQWEYACRAGTNTALNNGKNLTQEMRFCPNLDEVAWYNRNASEIIHEVGQKKPNAWGIYDMHGNVCEWCRDRIPDGFYWGYIYRGGNSYDYADECRSASRRSSTVGFRGFGFRVAIVPID